MDNSQDALASYAADDRHEGDHRAWVDSPVILGEYPVAGSDIVRAGTFTEELPEDFGLVSGDHSGLVLNNRDSRFNELKSEFFLAHVPDWWDQEYEIRLDAGYRDRITGELLTVEVYRGILGDLGPASRALGQPHNIEVYSSNFISRLMDTKIGYDSSGKPTPIFYGSWIAEAKKISGKTLGDPLRTIDFENNFDDCNRVEATGGATIAINDSTPLSGTQSLRLSTTGASQSATVQFDSPSPGTCMFAEFSVRFTTIPDTFADNLVFFQLLDNNGSARLTLKIGDADGWVYANTQKTDWNILATPGKRNIAVRLGPSKLNVWQDGNEVFTYDYTPGFSLYVAEFCATVTAAESWVLDFDDLRIWNAYYENCYQVDGGPFESIDTVYLDDLAQKTYVATPTPVGTILTKYPEWGAVTMRDTTDETKDLSGTVKFKVTANDTTHPVDQIEALITLAGGEDYIDTNSFAAAKAAISTYSTNCMFDGGSSAGDAIGEICQKCLVNVFMGTDIKISPYLGTAPATPSPLIARITQLEADELREVQTSLKLGELTTRIGAKKRVKRRVTATWGNFERQPDLTYTAGDAEADGEDLDLTYDSSVASENQEMVKSLADLYLLRLGPKRVWDPVRLSHRGLRLQAGDSVQVNEEFLMDGPMNFVVGRKEVNLDPPRSTILQLTNYLRET